MSLKNKLKNNNLTIGSWIMMNDPMSVEVMALAELVNSEHQDLARQAALVSLERLNGVRKMLRVSSPAQATSRSISDFIKTRKSQSHGSSSDDKAADDIVRQELTPASQSQADCLRQSGVGYFLEPDLPGFSEPRAL